jgi:hypothetical protein
VLGEKKGFTSYQTQTRVADRTGPGGIIPLELELGARRMETNIDSQMNAVFGLVVSTGKKRRTQRWGWRVSTSVPTAFRDPLVAPCFLVLCDGWNMKTFLARRSPS